MRNKTKFDSWQSISLALYMTLIGYGVMVGIPVISTAWSENLGFTAEQVGRVAGADMGGLSLGAVAAALIISRINRRYMVVVSAVITIVANYLCTQYQNYEIVLWLRVLSGFGNGIYIGVAVAALGATIKPARAYNLMLFAFAFSQALEVRLFPQLSMNGIYWFFIGCVAFGLLFTHWIVPFRKEIDTGNDENLAIVETNKSIPKYIIWMCMGAILFTYLSIGAYWVYIELASLSNGISDSWISGVLFWSSLLTLVGCAFAAYFNNRYGLAKPLIGAQILMIVIIGMLISGITNINLLISVFMFNFLWIFNDVFQMATVAILDKDGSFAALVPGAQGLGQIIGPNIAATILGAQYGYGEVFIMCMIAIVISLMIYLLMQKRLKLYAPKLLDA